jgi:hypothetical protein
MTKRNFLLGRGERLTSDVVVRSGGGKKVPPYSVSEAKFRLAPIVKKVSAQLDEIPAAAAPGGKVVAMLTLNPEYIAKSYFPTELLRTVGLEPVGSRPRVVKPEKRSRDRQPKDAVTTDLFVVGLRSAFKAWADGLTDWNEQSRAAAELVAIEDVHAPTAPEKIKGDLPERGDIILEVVLHADELMGEAAAVPNFAAYLKQVGLDAPLDRRFYAGGLCFLQVQAPAERAQDIATYSIVRAVRQMPRLRVLRPTIRASAIPAPAIALPSGGPTDPNIRAAIFDGGVPSGHAITRWATLIDAIGVADVHEEYLSHGLGVTSAFLFGHLDPRYPVSVPYCNVDHYRILDAAPGQDPRELFEVLDRIQTVLSQKRYHLVNLSLGPILPVEDDEVHAWTAVIDDLLASRDTLATIAVGNTGESDEAAGLNRIQVPADCVNALAIGACDSHDVGWRRATYSSVGPGRSPGLMKPDFVAFGGSMERPFLVVGSGALPTLEPIGGTSFAAPAVLRLGAGVRAHFGDSLEMLAIRTLLVHGTEPTDLPMHEVGRGRCARDLESLVLCDDDSVRVVYQGTISAAKYIRAPIPMPADTLTGKAVITATLCYTTNIDPHHPGNYTRAGLEATFRPHGDRRTRADQVHPDSKPFFGKAQKGLTEEELRRDAWKWENTLHASVSFYGTSLKNPAFDLHYNSRLEGHNHNAGQQLRYAMVISIKARREVDLYDRVVRRYATQLEPLRPVIDIPVRV